MARKYHQGIFKPTNPGKWVGDVNNISYRSSWELKFMKWADTHPSVCKVASEELIIPYYSPVDNKMHRYFTDFAIAIKQKDGSIKKYVVEIKPEAQTKPPVLRKRTDKYIGELTTWHVNQAKWKSADEYCKKNGMEFLVLTENHLFNGKHK